jgi:hypothetical protein
MKAKTSRKRKTKANPTVTPKAAASPVASIPETPATSVSVTLSPTDPRVLLHLAEQEPDFFELDDYAPVIRTLRDKGFTYREIAEWFTKRDVPLDHNAVYRVSLRGMHPEEARDEALQVEHERLLHG